MIVNDDVSDDENAPLLDRTRRRSPRQGCSRGLLWVIVLLCLATAVTRFEAVLTFPYLRTLQSCGPAGIGYHSMWSGSELCGDREFVARSAQADTNYMLCLGLIINSLCLPALGWLGDRCGRRPLITLYFLGLAFEAALNAASHRKEVFFVAVSIQKCTDGLTPAIIAMVADLLPAEERMSGYLFCVLAAAPTYTLTYGAVAYLVLSPHLRSYTHIWSLLGLLSFFCGCLSLIAPETLTSTMRAAAEAEAAERQREAAGGGGSHRGQSSRRESERSPRTCLSLEALLCCCHGRSRVKSAGGGGACGSSPVFAACANPSLRFVMLLEAPALLGIAAFSCLDGYALIACRAARLKLARRLLRYASVLLLLTWACSLTVCVTWTLAAADGWEQETMYYVRFATLPAAGLAASLSLCLIRRIEALRTLQLGIACLFFSLVAMCFAQWHVGLLYLALLLAGGSTLTLLPILRLVGAQAGPTQQASVAAALLAVAHASQAIGLLTHAFLFERAAAVGILFAPFALGAVAAAMALAIALCCAPSKHAWQLTPEDDRDA